MTEPVFFGTESEPAAEPVPAAPAEVQPEPAPETEPAPPVDADPQQVADEAAAAEPGTPALPDPDWLIEVRNNVPGIVGHALEQLYRLVTGG